MGIDPIIMAPKRRTRLGTLTHMNNLIGSGRDLLPSELPTLRDVMRYGIFLREQSGEDVSSQSCKGHLP